MSAINWFDSLNASTLMLVTPEEGAISQQRLANKYIPGEPTFAMPNPMPMDMITIDGLKIRYARSEKRNAPTVVLLCPV